MSHQDHPQQQRRSKPRLKPSRSVPQLKLFQPEPAIEGLGIYISDQESTDARLDPRRLDIKIGAHANSPTPPASPVNPASPRWTLPRSISTRWSFPLPTTASWAVTKAYNPTPPVPEKWPITTIPESAFSEKPIKHERYSYVDISSETEDVHCVAWISRQFRKLKRRLRRR